MSLITDLREERRLAKARIRPHLHFTQFSVKGILDEIRREHFADLPHSVSFYFVDRGPLACVCCARSKATIYVHQVLNHPETPPVVFDLICAHELLHLRIPPVFEDGRENQHPPEFWKAEKETCRRRRDAWVWIWRNYGACIRQRPRLKRIDVLPHWKEEWFRPKLDVAACYELTSTPPVIDEESGW